MLHQHPMEIATMVENVAPELRDKLREVFNPQGTGPVASSPHFMFIVCMALRGDTAVDIANKLETEKKQFIEPQAIRDYVLTYVPAELIRPNLILKYYEKMPISSELTVIETAMKMQAQKVAKIYDNPQVTVEDRESARRDMELLVRTAEASIKLKNELGMIKRDTSPAHNDPKPVEQHQHLHLHGIQLDPRKASAALSAVKRIKQLAALDVPPEPKKDPPDGNI